MSLEAREIVHTMNQYKAYALSESKKLHKYLQAGDTVDTLSKGRVVIRSVLSEDVFLDSQGNPHMFNDIVKVVLALGR